MTSNDRLKLVTTDRGMPACGPEDAAGTPNPAREVGGEAGEQIAAHVPSLFACVRALAGDRSAVDDIVHETVVQALEGWRRYDATRDLGAWLRGIAVHLVRRHWRKIRRGRAAIVSLTETYGDRDTGPQDPEGEAAGRQEARRMLAALDRLSPNLREAFVLRVVEGLSGEEVARVLKTSPAAVHTRVCKARAILLEAIGDAGSRGEKGCDHD
ncbi:MAG: sigma-70 family RNA polymerase sigma factor [Deltaproteobacteria bacterium]|nr:sigma-70 family RNA polymerase sigma factor [Deltaproteobacteria bacterium]